jgi:sulfoxide reductase heme-binding subunit YedZ
VTSTTTWYAARAGGLVAYLLVSASVLAGILLAGKRHVPGLPRFAVEDVHRFLGLLAGIFIVVHVGSVALDSVVPFSPAQLLVPFTADYRPLATGLGIVALELLLAVSATNLLRSRLPYRVWRRVHYATLAVWLLATVHGILSGTDRDQAWLMWIYASTVAAVIGSAALRFSRSPGARRYVVGLTFAVGGVVLALALSAIPQRASSAEGSETAAAALVPEIRGALSGTIDARAMERSSPSTGARPRQRSGSISSRATARSPTAHCNCASRTGSSARER